MPQDAFTFVSKKKRFLQNWRISHSDYSRGRLVIITWEALYSLTLLTISFFRPVARKFASCIWPGSKKA